MFWREDTQTILVFLDGTTNPATNQPATPGARSASGEWYTFKDTWSETDSTPEPVATPPPGLYAPVRGFGKIWYSYPGLRQSLGWATDQEAGLQAAWQPYQSGSMLWIGSDHIIYVLDDNSTWESFQDTYVAPTPTASRAQN